MRKQKKILEKDIQYSICEYLEAKRIFFWRQNNIPVRLGDGSFRSMPKYSKRGVPDIIVILPPDGMFLAIEVKRPEGVLSEHQKAFRDALVALGGRYVVANSLDDILALGI